MATVPCENCDTPVAANELPTTCGNCGAPVPMHGPKSGQKRKPPKQSKSTEETDFDPLDVLMGEEAEPDSDLDADRVPKPKTTSAKAAAKTARKKTPPETSPGTESKSKPDGRTSSAAEKLIEATNRPRAPRSVPESEASGRPSFFDRFDLHGDRTKTTLLGVSVLALALVAGFALRGCDDDRVPTYPVSGRVVFEDGTPVRLGVVEVEATKDSLPSLGTIQQDGTFVLGTYTSDDGAPEGTRPAIVVQMLINDGTIKHSIDHGKPVNPKYGSYLTSQLEVVIRPIEQNEIEIRLQAE